METARAEHPLAPDLDLLCCPRCGSGLHRKEPDLHCSKCDSRFPLCDGIPSLFCPNEWPGDRRDVTDDIRAFYEETPFPNYDDFDSVGSLIEKARRGMFAKLLDDQVPPKTRIIECGCGTGQLSNFLSIANRDVFGTDLCLNSLKLGDEFKRKNGLQRVRFLQMNLFRPAFKPASFDLVISNGVLHHTADPALAFRSISTLIKPGGYILIGLYHRYGRLTTDLRRLIFRFSGDRFTGLDPNLRAEGFAQAKWKAWFMDQYKNPHESKHTIGEVLRWLPEAGLQFVKSIPRSKPFQPIATDEQLFAPEQPGNWLERVIAELGMLRGGSREGGFFTVVARKPSRGASS